MEKYLLPVVIVLVSMIIGYLIGKSNGKPKANGFIYLEKNEDGDDRIRFYLDMEYDDIANYSRVVFEVVNQQKM